MTENVHPGNPFAIEGAWYRGNLHTHSTNSDGRKSVADAVGWYRDQGYDFVALTDHRVLSDTRALAASDFVTIPGMEMHGPDPDLGVLYHILGLGIRSFERSSDDCPAQDAIDRVNADGGVAILAHPYWLGQSAYDMRNLRDFVGMEVFNSICDVDRAKGHSAIQWDDYCNAYGLTWGLATDDSHWIYGEEGRGWIVARASDLSLESILAAIRNGHFYSSTGPEIHDVRFADGKVSVRCSPARRISVMASRATGRSFLAGRGGLLTEVERELSGNERYVRIEVEDAEGRQAWTNPQAV